MYWFKRFFRNKSIRMPFVSGKRVNLALQFYLNHANNLYIDGTFDFSYFDILCLH